MDKKIQREIFLARLKKQRDLIAQEDENYFLVIRQNLILLYGYHAAKEDYCLLKQVPFYEATNVWRYKSPHQGYNEAPKSYKRQETVLKNLWQDKERFKPANI